MGKTESRILENKSSQNCKEKLTCVSQKLSRHIDFIGEYKRSNRLRALQQQKKHSIWGKQPQKANEEYIVRTYGEF